MAQPALRAMRDSKDRRRPGLPEEVTPPGQRAGQGEEHAVLTQFLHFFHGNCSVDWTLQQAGPQEGEKSGNEELNGEKVQQRDERKEQAQGAREKEESETRREMQEGRKSAQIRKQASEVSEEWKSVNKLATFRLEYPGKDICTCQRGVGAAVEALLCTSRCLGTCPT